MLPLVWPCHARGLASHPTTGGPLKPGFGLSGGSSDCVNLGNRVKDGRGFTVLEEGAESQPDVISVVARDIARVNHSQGESV